MEGPFWFVDRPPIIYLEAAYRFPLRIGRWDPPPWHRHWVHSKRLLVVATPLSQRMLECVPPCAVLREQMLWNHINFRYPARRTRFAAMLVLEVTLLDNNDDDWRYVAGEGE